MSVNREFLKLHFPNITDQKITLLDHYIRLLLETNEVINLISRKDTSHVFVRHLLHSLSIAKVNEFASGQKVLDIGTGGGLPGIPLAIMHPQTQFYLVDSIGKKTAAVKRMSDDLGLENVIVKNERVENLKIKFDFAVSRAVTALPKIATWLDGKIVKGHNATLPNGLIYIKGGDFSEELKEISKPFKIWDIQPWFEDEFFETKKVVWIDLANSKF